MNEHPKHPAHTGRVNGASQDPPAGVEERLHELARLLETGLPPAPPEAVRRRGERRRARRRAGAAAGSVGAVAALALGGWLLGGGWPDGAPLPDRQPVPPAVTGTPGERTATPSPAGPENGGGTDPLPGEEDVRDGSSVALPPAALPWSGALVWQEMPDETVYHELRGLQNVDCDSGLFARYPDLPARVTTFASGQTAAAQFRVVSFPAEEYAAAYTESLHLPAHDCGLLVPDAAAEAAVRATAGTGVELTIYDQVAATAGRRAAGSYLFVARSKHMVLSVRMITTPFPTSGQVGEEMAMLYETGPEQKHYRVTAECLVTLVSEAAGETAEGAASVRDGRCGGTGGGGTGGGGTGGGGTAEGAVPATP
ncbi:hypothetical protein [Streptomyces aidingensis]|uniref:PknH-like extracellular domain-containing protein n=1 Tax=Streptomyces aidingensis TaxID=910347 RepID=A0A1I1STC8_9ACTN|nr:hypothetical protein [Streptomyces aidingensis]SFD49705.1 hypothetical protein SAMN05421773_11733 [Streptomyces aidingensis]